MMETIPPLTAAPATPTAPRAVQTDVKPISLDDRLREVEADLIKWALKVADGNKSKAAALLQIKRSTLGDRIKRCGLGVAATSNAEAEPLLAAVTEPAEAATP